MENKALSLIEFLRLNFQCCKSCIHLEECEPYLCPKVERDKLDYYYDSIEAEFLY